MERTLFETMQMIGGPFIWGQVLIGLLIIIQTIYVFRRYLNGKDPGQTPFFRSHHLVLFLGVLSLVWGMLTQLIGLVHALNAIIAAADISPGLIFMGLRNSFIAPLIGLGTMLVCGAIWGLLEHRFSRLRTTE